MRKKLISSMIALAFVVSSLLLVTCCAKKQVQVSEPTIKEKEQEKAEAEERARRAREAKERQAKLGAEEAERQAKARAKGAELHAKAVKERIAAQRLADQIKAFESEHIYFAFDKYDLLHYARVVLKDKAAWLRANPAYSVWVEGHCDERGTNEYNLALGESRADVAMKFLVTLGVSKNRIKTISYGEERPADLGQNEQAWAKNRRDEFKLFKAK